MTYDPEAGHLQEQNGALGSILTCTQLLGYELSGSKTSLTLKLNNDADPDTLEAAQYSVPFVLA